MINKLWYKGHVDLGETEEQCKALVSARKRIQVYIDLYCSHEFTVPEDITADNLDKFFKIILPLYEKYLFSVNELWCLGESIDLYFHRAYFYAFPETMYPEFPDNDKRSIALTILNLFYSIELIFPEDVPFLLGCLDAPTEDIEALSKNGIEDYFKQFDQMQRCNVESAKRTKLLKEQRLIAIAKGEPLPIKPMGMKLDPCYKKTS